MTDDLRFDGRVAIITGAGNGLGRSHALLLASRGCKVVVNDLGGSAHGTGQSTSAADRVVAEIKSAGGDAVANYDSVENGDKIVKTAIDAWGRVDIVVNNAGILRDTSFQKMSVEDWDIVYRVHLNGSFRVTHAAWNYMREAGYGRIIFTSSAAGIYGNFGQANYGAMKLGLLGLSNTLAVEGRKRNVRANTIAPIAGSRLTETVLPKEIVDALKPEYVSPLVAWLAHESCEETGGLFEVGGGAVSKLRWQRTEGAMYRPGRAITPEGIRAKWGEVTDFEKVAYPSDITASMAPVLANLQSTSKGGNEFIDVDQALGHELPTVTSSYSERDVAVYALGIGAAVDPLDASELQYVYEMHGDGFRVLPTFGVIPAINAIIDLAKQGKQAPGLNYGIERLLHGEQYTELKRPMPPHATLTHKSRVKDIFDKGKNAVVVTETRSFDESGQELVYNEFTAVIRGAGGWGGDRGPTTDANAPPDRAPDAVVSERTHENQALLYRLTGDINPLHADPGFATAVGFPRPILHGLCTYGYAARHAIKAFCGNDARKFKSIKARFADSVFPGETLVTEMWKLSDTRIVFRCRVKERDKVVISSAAVELFSEIPTAKSAAVPAKTEAASASAPSNTAEGGSGDVFVAIRDHVERNPDLVAKVATVFQFKLTQPDSAWVIDLKSAPGSVTAGASDKPDVTLELSDADFMAMTSGAADPQKLYFAGKLKISGNLMASQKLGFLKKIDPNAAREAVARARSGGAPASSAVAPSSKSTVTARAPAIFQALTERVAKTPNLSADVAAVIEFKVREPDGTWTVDLRTAPGSVRAAAAAKADVTLALTDEDLGALAQGTSVRELYQNGRVRIDGDVRIAHRLGFLKNLA